MPLEWRTSVFAQHLVTMLKAAPVVLQVQGTVFYGDQENIPGGYVLCVEPSSRSRELAGIPRKTNVEIEVFIFLYVSFLQDSEANRLEADRFVESIEDVLHADAQLTELCIHSMVARTESGFAAKGNTVRRVTRLTFNISSQQRLAQ